MKNMRTCVSCRAKQDKQNMLRVAKNKNGNIVIDDAFVAEGRGAYVCNNKGCINKLIKSKALNRSFKAAIGPEIYEQIGEKFGDK